MKDCLFCKIAAGEIPSEKVFENENMLIINDINPQAKIHLLVIPKQHYDNLEEMAANNPDGLAEVLHDFAQVAPSLGLEGGYRIVSNKGPIGCQSVNHLHVHILGGEQLSEKMS